MTEQEGLEINIEEARKVIARRDSLVKLRGNKEFKEVIEDSYFKEEATRLVMAKGAGLKPEQEDNIDKMMYGIGALVQYLDNILRMGDEMEQVLREDEETLSDLANEGLV